MGRGGFAGGTRGGIRCWDGGSWSLEVRGYVQSRADVSCFVSNAHCTHYQFGWVACGQALPMRFITFVPLRFSPSFLPSLPSPRAPPSHHCPFFRSSLPFLIPPTTSSLPSRPSHYFPPHYSPPPRPPSPPHTLPTTRKDISPHARHDRPRSSRRCSSCDRGRAGSGSPDPYRCRIPWPRRQSSRAGAAGIGRRCRMCPVLGG